MLKNKNYDDKAMLKDDLDTQKFVTGNYNEFANECATPCVREDVLKILTDEHTIQNELFCEMQNRGWYETPAAEQPKIDAAKQKFQNA